MMKYRKPKIRKHLVEEPNKTWDEVSKKIIEEAENGVITIPEAREKLSKSFKKEWLDPDGDAWGAFIELDEMKEKVKFKSLNVHGNVYDDFIKISREDGRSIASTVALITKDYRYARREKRKINYQLQELQDLKMKKIFGGKDER